MHVFKELYFLGDKKALENFKLIASTFTHSDWKYTINNNLSAYVLFDYCGDRCDKAELSIYVSEDAWRKGVVRVTNIVPLQKGHLTIEEYNSVLDRFYEDIIVPNKNRLVGIQVKGPTSGIFDPLECISKEALTKLELFCNSANKSTGSAHPCDEERWFDFICQTVDDNQVFDYDTIYRFLMDEEYWGKNNDGYVGVIGRSAWDQEKASELASEYDNYVRLLQFYLNKCGGKE